MFWKGPQDDPDYLIKMNIIVGSGFVFVGSVFAESIVVGSIVVDSIVVGSVVVGSVVVWSVVVGSFVVGSFVVGSVVVGLLSLGPLSLDPRYCVLPPTPMALFTGHWSCQLSELPAFNVSCPLLDNILCDIRLLASCKNTKTEYAQFCWVNVNHSKQPCKDLDC